MKKVWELCKETNKSFNTSRGFLNHLRTLKMTSKEYYDKHYKTENEGICYCGNKTTYHGYSYKKYCSDICGLKDEPHRKSVRERFINNPKALENVRNNRKLNPCDPNIDKRRKTIKQKCEKLNITEYEYYSNHAKKCFLSLTKEQVNNRTIKIMESKKASGKIGGRSGYKKYPFFDTEVSLQGYEPIVLDFLINNYNLQKQNICCGKKNIPIIKYSDNNGKTKMYFPDFYLPKYNLLIEVKSGYTLMQHLENVIKKCEYSVISGYSIALLVLSKYEARNRKLDACKNILDWAISSQVPNPFWYGKGSTTILNGVESSDSKSSFSLI